MSRDARKDDRAGKKPWSAPRITYLGKVDRIIKRGAGKLSIPGLDPGEPTKKPRGRDR